ncbi:ketoacyl-synt-domain-containing protein [Periconia macrospinosa]|uniref:Ketoacyl-synt-domain-containing protein n=1 Tax=Periconia macrospinosa TaxID=97972 RepID=A0A2V1D534_9PLEO|nr:ketoacyl-synt-domain-containing protein [Periconia macrospinosa]
MKKGNLVVFGSQCFTFSQDDAARLHENISDCAELDWILETLQTLRNHWSHLSAAVPLLQRWDGEARLQELAIWAQSGTSGCLSWPLPNTILTPLVVAQHLAEFYETAMSRSRDRELVLDGITIGLSTGLLGSAAVSCSKNWQDFTSNGAVAIRLAVLIGAVVDATDFSLPEQEQATSLSVVWAQSGGRETLNHLLGTIERAYISVTQSENKVTVTASKSAVEDLVRNLEQSGFASVEIALRGRFHWQGYLGELQGILVFCQSNPYFQFISKPILPLIGHQNISSSKTLVDAIIRSILVTESDWHGILTSLNESWDIQCPSPRITCIGTERYIPSSLKHALSKSRGAQEHVSVLDPCRDRVAVIGMACHVPGAEDIHEFWGLLCRAESQHIEVPPERIVFNSPWRTTAKREWYGNFVGDYDTFDERFFGKSAREAASTDPQQQLMLQVAYQAVEQSGYLSHADNDTGCYIAVGLTDYEQNIACHPATSYSATGNLRAFAAGKISHFFGWTGPGLTIDSACSSSAAAIHLACQSILAKDCNTALVGGVNIMTGADWFHNLAGASFLSPTGQCKPFDVHADGYCRGEAVGAVFLKRLSSALQDGDQILGVIAASGVQRNGNFTSITVPNEYSLECLFRNVVKRSGLSPGDVSYVEAHGTGTMIGDPAEYNSIRSVFGGSTRKNGENLKLGSVKGLLGHSEAASGIVALLKVLLMIQHGAIPPQASFTSLNPALNALPADQIEINTDLAPWNVHFRAALINNYGASGSNASLVVTQPPPRLIESHLQPVCLDDHNNLTHPFVFYSLNDRGIQRYSSKLLAFVKANKNLSLADISFQLARQSNQSLRCVLAYTCQTKSELVQTLERWNPEAVVTVPLSRPVILCFGGQRTTFIGLCRLVYNSSKILCSYLDECNAICRTLETSIYPAIHQTTPISDIVQLHASLFSIQYSSAKSWIECIHDTSIAVVGHSFGELAALCIAGVVSLEDMLGFVVGRAKLIRDRWGTEKGSMVAVEADLETVNNLLQESGSLNSLNPTKHVASIACHNGPKSFTIAGPSDSIDTIVEILRKRDTFSSVKFKRLDVTNAYHCSLVDSILPGITELSSRVKFRQASTYVELATKHNDNMDLENFLATHLRRPVYFSDAVRRLATKYDSAVWLEAGTNSTVTMMASRALQDISLDESPNKHHFQSVNLSTGGGPQAIPEVTTELRREGIKVTFWPHHRGQVEQYQEISLPPYQFEKKRHWMERKSLEPHFETILASPNTLWSFVDYENERKRSVRFRVHNHSERFMSIVKGHVIGRNTPVCPSTLQLEIAIDALMSLNPHFRDGTYHPQILDTISTAPMFLDPNQEIWLYAHAVDDSDHVWNWSMSGTTVKNDSSGKTIKHVTGTIVFHLTKDPKAMNEFAKLERLIRSERCANLLDGNAADGIIQGQQHIYSLFSDVVKYDNRFRGLQKLVSKGTYESAARMEVPRLDKKSGTTWLDYARADCFYQVAGIFANIMTNKPPADIYISDKINQWIRSPQLQMKKL